MEKIIPESDGILIGRGDLALSANYANLAKYEQEIAEQCHLNKCKIYIATDILNTLCEKQLPHRAEIVDIAYMLKLGINNLILSGPLCRYNQYNLAVEYIRMIEKINDKL